MLLLTATCSYIPLPHRDRFSFSQCSLAPSLILERKPKKRDEIFKRGGVLTVCLGFKAWKLERNLGKLWACLSDVSDGNVELESEIMDFMAKSKEPSTKEELINGGKMDLEEAITKDGGRYSFGSDEENVLDIVEESQDLDTEDSLMNQVKDGFSSEEKLNFQHLSTPAALEKPLATGVNSGIEGILSRLERQRNQENLDNNATKAHFKTNDDRKDGHFDASLGVAVKARFGLGEKGKLTDDFQHKGALNISDAKVSRNIETESWRIWSIKQAGYQYKDSEAAEINFSNNRVETERENYHDADKGKVLHYSEMKTRLHNIESELASSMQFLISKRKEWTSPEVSRSSENLLKLSDALEFQENELLRAQSRLRVLKAELAIAEGKLTLARIEAKKKVQLKLKQVNAGNEALQLLRTMHFVWHNPASEVFLAGSFDGWTMKRKMKRSKMGTFSLCLLLYPGRYEIKFIVDGMWKVDPLRPTISTSGHMNNLFIVT